MRLSKAPRIVPSRDPVSGGHLVIAGPGVSVLVLEGHRTVLL